MRAMLLRLGVLTVGFGVTEVALTGVFGSGGPGDWGLLLLVGLPLLVAGTLGFLTPMFRARSDERTRA